jgi:hypothetical protein
MINKPNQLRIIIYVGVGVNKTMTEVILPYLYYPELGERQVILLNPPPH